MFHDDEITVYAAAAKERLCSDGRHLIVVMNRHVERVYDLVSGLEVCHGVMDTRGFADEAG